MNIVKALRRFFNLADGRVCDLPDEERRKARMLLWGGGAHGSPKHLNKNGKIVVEFDNNDNE